MIKCIVCKKTFFSRRNNAYFCSVDCADDWAEKFHASRATQDSDPHYLHTPECSPGTSIGKWDCKPECRVSKAQQDDKGFTVNKDGTVTFTRPGTAEIIGGGGRGSKAHEVVVTENPRTVFQTDTMDVKAAGTTATASKDKKGV